MKRLSKLNSITIMKFVLCFMISSIMICCDKNDSPDYNYPDDPEETEDPYLVDGLRYEINEDGNTCTLIGQKNQDIPNHLVIPETVEILNQTYTVTKIAKYSYIGKKSVQISNTITRVEENAISGSVVQVIVGSNVSWIDTHAWSAIKVIWLINSRYSEGTFQQYIYSVGKVNYISTDKLSGLNYKSNYYYPCTTVLLSNLSSLFWVDGILFTLIDPSERTCIAIGYDYAEREKITIPKTITKEGIQLKVTEIGDFLFAGADYLTTVENLTSISNGMFYKCSDLQSVEIEAEVPSIGENAFNYCESLKSMNIKDGQSVLEIKYNVGITNELNYVIPAPYTPSPIFSNTGIKELYIGRKIKYSTSPFQDLISLEKVTISDIETTIYNKEFYGCTNLKSLTIGDGVETIGSYAFSGCSSMETFTVGSGVKSIGADAFSDCTSLISLTTQALEPPTCGDQALDDIDKWNCKLYVPDESVEAYKEAPQWKNFLFIE